MSYGGHPECFDDLDAVRAKFIELWAKYPDRTANEVAESAFRLCGLEPGFRFAQMATIWAADLEVLEARDALRPTARNPDAKVPDKATLIAEMLELARNDRVDPKDRATLYKTVLEAEGHITKNVDKNVNKSPPVPSAIMFRAVDFDREPDSEEEAA